MHIVFTKCLYSHVFIFHLFVFFFFNDTATTEIYTLSLHDALPILRGRMHVEARDVADLFDQQRVGRQLERLAAMRRSEEHTSELQSHHDLVCRLLLEKKKNKKKSIYITTLTQKKLYRPHRSCTLRS